MLSVYREHHHTIGELHYPPPPSPIKLIWTITLLHCTPRLIKQNLYPNSWDDFLICAIVYCIFGFISNQAYGEFCWMYGFMNWGRNRGLFAEPLISPHHDQSNLLLIGSICQWGGATHLFSWSTNLHYGLVLYHPKKVERCAGVSPKPPFFFWGFPGVSPKPPFFF